MVNATDHLFPSPSTPIKVFSIKSMEDVHPRSRKPPKNLGFKEDEIDPSIKGSQHLEKALGLSSQGEAPHVIAR